MRLPGIEPGSQRWQRRVIAPKLQSQNRLFFLMCTERRVIRSKMLRIFGAPKQLCCFERPLNYNRKIACLYILRTAIWLEIYKSIAIELLNAKVNSDFRRQSFWIII